MLHPEAVFSGNAAVLCCAAKAADLKKGRYFVGASILLPKFESSARNLNQKRWLPRQLRRFRMRWTEMRSVGYSPMLTFDSGALQELEASKCLRALTNNSR